MPETSRPIDYLGPAIVNPIARTFGVKPEEVTDAMVERAEGMQEEVYRGEMRFDAWDAGLGYYVEG